MDRDHSAGLEVAAASLETESEFFDVLARLERGGIVLSVKLMMNTGDRVDAVFRDAARCKYDSSGPIQAYRSKPESMGPRKLLFGYR